MLPTKNIVNIASEKSLWRIRNQSNIAAVKELEKVSKRATEDGKTLL